MPLGFGRKGSLVRNDEQDADAVLKELNEKLSPQLKQALIDTELIIHSEDKSHVQSVLRRFLVAEKMDINSALRRMEKHVQWRQQVLPHAIQETQVIDQINQGKVLLQPKGPDGRPLLVIRLARHFATTTVQCETFVTFCLEATSKLCDTAPTGDDPHTRKKVSFISELDSLLNIVDKSIIPEVYGGLASEVPMEIAVRRMNAGNSSSISSGNGNKSFEEVEKAGIAAKERPAVVAVGA